MILWSMSGVPLWQVTRSSRPQRAHGEIGKNEQRNGTEAGSQFVHGDSGFPAEKRTSEFSSSSTAESK